MEKRPVWNFLFGLYCAFMLWLLFHRPGYEAGIPYLLQLKINLVPLRTIRQFWHLLLGSHYQRHAFKNLLGNFLLFIPLGFLLPLNFTGLKGFWRTLLASLLLIIAVELVQLFTLVGCCDIDDLILNLPGAALGYGLYALRRNPQS